jgi:hypothetical protein
MRLDLDRVGGEASHRAIATAKEGRQLADGVVIADLESHLPQ